MRGFICNRYKLTFRGDIQTVVIMSENVLVCVLIMNFLRGRYREHRISAT